MTSFAKEVLLLKAVLKLETGGRVGSGQVGDENRDNRANSAQFQVKLPTGAELGKIT